MKSDKLPSGWDDQRVYDVLAHYESQTEEEAVVEDEEALRNPDQTVMEIPNRLVPVVRELIARHSA
jgi:hypothetical protein